MLVYNITACDKQIYFVKRISLSQKTEGKFRKSNDSKYLPLVSLILIANDSCLFIQDYAVKPWLVMNANIFINAFSL